MAKYNKLQDKHVLVIGGSAGIGKAVAAASLEAGARVTISSSSKARLDSAVRELQSSTGAVGQRISGIAADLSGADTIETNVEELFRSAEQAGPVDHVVFTAGDNISATPISEFQPAQAHAAIQFRMIAQLVVAKVAARHLPSTRASSLTLTGGSLSERPAKGYAMMSFLGGGIQAVTRALAVEMAPVRVNLVRPGIVDTGLWDGLGAETKKRVLEAAEATAPTGKVGQVEDVAVAYLWLMKDGNASGSVAGTDGGSLLV
ncbi:hypothetical protein RB595_010401 [Gaeumannomyces hyphopodioides]